MKISQSKLDQHFGEVERTGYLPDSIADDILAKVRSGILNPGDCLPTEIIMAERYGVSRNVVREAIARLRSDGVIATKQGRGAVIKPTSERATFRVDPRDMQDDGTLAQLFELRAILEIDTAGIAAQRRTDQDLERLESAMDTMRQAKSFDDIRLKADARFHSLLGRATGNLYLAGFVDYISGRLEETTRATQRIYEKNDLLELTIQEHDAVLDAVRSSDTLGARAAMARHVQAAAIRIEVTLPAGALEI